MRRLSVLFSTGLLCLLSGCFKKDDYGMVQDHSLLKFKFVTQAVEADGASTGIIGLSIDSKAVPSRRKVLLKTSLGTFSGGTGDSIWVEADQQFQATAQLLSSRTGEATIKAIIAGREVVAEPRIVFVRAYPDKITASVDSFSIINNYKSEVLISAVLQKNGGGVPSQGQRVNFEVLTANNKSVGFFLNNRSFSTTDGNGKASVRYVAGDETPQRLSIIASTQKADSSFISDTTYIFLTL